MFVYSDREAKSCKLTIDQTVAKPSEPSFPIESATSPRVFKPKKEKSKARRSPYPASSQSAEYSYEPAPETKYPEKYDYTSEMGTFHPGYQGYAIPEGMERYYHPAYMHSSVGFYDSACLYPTYQGRVQCKEEIMDVYHTRAESGYMAYPADQTRLMTFDKPDPTKEQMYIYGSAGYADANRTVGAESSLVRDRLYETRPTLLDRSKFEGSQKIIPRCRSVHGPYSNRSDSSHSDVDVVSHEEQNQRRRASHSEDMSSPYMSEVSTHESRASNIVSQTSLERRQSKSDCMKSLGYHQQMNEASVIMRRQPSQDFTNELMKTSPKSEATYTNLDSTHRLTHDVIDLRVTTQKSLDIDQQYTCAKTLCGYSYNPHEYPGQPNLPQRYGSIPAAGYTSVIVDPTQQYQVANGYVH